MDPMDQIKKLRDAVDEALKDLDLQRVTFTIIPGENGQQDSIGMIFKVDPKALMSAEQRNIDSAFEDLMSDFIADDAAAEADQKLNDVKKMISDWMDDEGSAAE
jgi:hypothetical protein